MPTCYSVLALKPWEIDNLTPGEIIDMYEGWMIRRRRQEELLANFITLPIYNHQRGKKDKLLTLKDLFGAEGYKRRFGEPNKPTAEELHKEFFE